MNTAVERISLWTGVSLIDAIEIRNVMDSEALIDWSEATEDEFTDAIGLARTFIRNGRSWE